MRAGQGSVSLTSGARLPLITTGVLPLNTALGLAEIALTALMDFAEHMTAAVVSISLGSDKPIGAR